MGGVHEVSHHERGVLHAVPVPRLGEDNDHRGGSVEGVSRRALNLGVQAAQAGDVAPVLHGHYERGLFALSGRGVGAGLEDGVELLVTYLFGFILSHAAAREQIFICCVQAKHLLAWYILHLSATLIKRVDRRKLACYHRFEVET